MYSLSLRLWTYRHCGIRAYATELVQVVPAHSTIEDAHISHTHHALRIWCSLMKICCSLSRNLMNIAHVLSRPTFLFVVLGCCETMRSSKQLLDRMGISEEDMEDASLYYAAEGDTQVLNINEGRHISHSENSPFVLSSTFRDTDI